MIVQNMFLGAIVGAGAILGAQYWGKIPWVMMRFRKYKWVQDLTRQNI